MAAKEAGVTLSHLAVKFVEQLLDSIELKFDLSGVDCCGKSRLTSRSLLIDQTSLILSLFLEHLDNTLRSRPQLILVEVQVPVDLALTVLRIELVLDLLARIAQVEHELARP